MTSRTVVLTVAVLAAAACTASTEDAHEPTSSPGQSARSELYGPLARACVDPSPSRSKLRALAYEPSSTWVTTIDLGGFGGTADGATAINELGVVTGQVAVSDDTRGFVWADGEMTTFSGPARSTSPWAINERGDVVGSASTVNGESHAFLWRDGAFVDLGTLGGKYSDATDINDRGQVVGTSWTADGHFHAFLWEDGLMTDLGTLGGPGSQAWQIDELGRIVGSADTAEGAPHAVLWQGGVITDLGTLGTASAYSDASHINARGQIVGSSRLTHSSSDSRAFVWQDGAMTDLGTLGGPQSWAVDINERGQVVGTSMVANHLLVAFLWEHGVMIPLVVSDGEPAPSSAVAISESGQVVGFLFGPRRQPVRAFSWQDGELTLLGPESELSAAAAVNDRGEIVGHSGGRATLWKVHRASRDGRWSQPRWCRTLAP